MSERLQSFGYRERLLLVVSAGLVSVALSACNQEEDLTYQETVLPQEMHAYSIGICDSVTRVRYSLERVRGGYSLTQLQLVVNGKRHYEGLYAVNESSGLADGAITPDEKKELVGEGGSPRVAVLYAGADKIVLECLSSSQIQEGEHLTGTQP